MLFARAPRRFGATFFLCVCSGWWLVVGPLQLVMNAGACSLRPSPLPPLHPSTAAFFCSHFFKIHGSLGMFDPPASVPYNSITHADVGSPAHIALAETAARQGMTLLRNTVVGPGPALPVNLADLPRKRIALVGPNADASYILLGSYSDLSCCSAGIPTLLEELTTRAQAAGVTVNYAPGCANQSCLSTEGFAAAASAAAGRAWV